jgi:hypothetical protein
MPLLHTTSAVLLHPGTMNLNPKQCVFSEVMPVDAVHMDAWTSSQIHRPMLPEHVYLLLFFLESLSSVLPFEAISTTR